MAIATTQQRNTLATAYGAGATHAALFTADPGTSGTATGEVSGGSYVRKAITWSTANNGQVTGQVVFNVPAGVTVTHAAVTGGVSGSNVLDRIAVTSQTFSTAGTYTLNLAYTQS